jgi:amidase
MDDLAFLPATAQAELVRRREVSPYELVRVYLERIERLNPRVNAYVTVCAERALDEARALERRPTPAADRPFLGVPIAIKDLDDTAGLRTTYGCRAFAEHVPAEDAFVVRRLKRAGFIVIGKTNVPEFGTLPVTESDLHGPCRSPWDLSRTAGGSSGGAAAAVASGLAPVAQGNDGGGSIRVPAACCGLVGLKPSRGRVSWGPSFGELIASLATHGVLARNVLDAAAVLDVMAGPETGDPFFVPAPERPFADEVGKAPGRLRIGVTTASVFPVDPACEAAVGAAAKLLASLGHDVEQAAPDWLDPMVFPPWNRLWQTIPANYDCAPEQLEPLNRFFAEMAEGTSSLEYVRSLNTVQRFARRAAAFWDTRDVLLMPSTALPAVPIGWLNEPTEVWDRWWRAGTFVGMTPAVNMLGHPAVSLPLHWTAAGLPVGVQLIGAPAAEATLVRLAAQVEAASSWKDRRPPIA